MTNETLKIPRLYRSAEMQSVERADEVDDRRIEVAFSSDVAVERFFGNEILDHEPGSVRLKWFRGGTAPLLLDHDPRQQIGVIEQVELGSDRVGRAQVRFGQSALAEEVLRDVRDDIRRNTSVGYNVHHLIREEQQEGEDTFRVVDWEPMEISIVSVPADQSVGVGRDDNEAVDATIENPKSESETMTTETTTKPAEVVRAEPIIPEVDTEKLTQDAMKAERQRNADISALGARHNVQELAGEHIKKGTPLDAFRGILLEHLPDATPLDNTTSDLGMEDKEVREYSIVRALHAAASGDWSKAGLEREASQAIAGVRGTPKGFYVPLDVQRSTVEMKRDLSVGTSTAGGHLVGTDHLGASFIEILRNAMMVRRMGARILSGLNGNVAIPKQTGAGTHTWISTEGGAATETNQTFGQVTLAPKTLGAFTEMTRQLLLQSDPSVEQIVRQDLAMVLALAIDLAAINGSGASGQPEGVLQTTGIGDVAGGTNGLAPTWANIVNIWKEVAIDNADFGATGFMVNATTVGKLATTEKASGTAQFIVPDLPGPDGMTSIAGQRAGVSNQVPSNLTKGSGTDLSAIVYGNWADLLIGEWGTLDLLVDPYTSSASGTVRVSAFQSVDTAVRRAESFSAMQDAITA